MVTVYDVPPDRLISALAEYLKKNVPEVNPPPWAMFVKTAGPARLRPPDNPGWWYIRAASILRKLYIHGPVGIERLRTAYGGRVRGKVKPEIFKKGSGAIIRKILQQLEKAGLVYKVKDKNGVIKGRALTPEGRSLLDTIATKVFREVCKEVPELKKYAVP
ncbi:MAG: 30S ribosomal protein S19e [Thermoprotei archaeon]|nr:30S ribosomal protein S19e [Thermoprotei archaeon]